MRYFSLVVVVVVVLGFGFTAQEVRGFTPQQGVADQNDVTDRHMLVLYDQRSPDLAFTLTWAGKIARQCDKVDIPWFTSDIRTATMTNDHVGRQKTPRDEALTPPWFLKKFDHSFAQGSVILQGYGRKNGNIVRFRSVITAGSIVGPGRFVRQFSIDAVTPLLKEIMQAPAQDWMDATEEPEGYDSKQLEDSVVLAKANYGVIARRIYILGSGPPDRQQPKAWLDYAVGLSQQAGLPASGANLWEQNDREHKDNMPFAPNWLFDRFARFLENGLIVVAGYGTKNGTFVRYRRIMIAGYGGTGGGQPAEDVRGFVREIKNSPSSEWLDASERPDVIATGHGDQYFNCEDPNNPSTRREVLPIPEPMPERTAPPQPEPPVQKVQPPGQTKEKPNNVMYKIAIVTGVVFIVALIAALIALHRYHIRIRESMMRKGKGAKPDRDPELA